MADEQAIYDDYDERNQTRIDNTLLAKEAIIKRLFPHLNIKFLQAMDDIGRHGHNKHKDKSFQAKVLKGDFSRWERVTVVANGMHSAEHYYAYMDGIRHDHFNDLTHQLAAAAFNVMMEYHFSRLEEIEGRDDIELKSNKEEYLGLVNRQFARDLLLGNIGEDILKEKSNVRGEDSSR